jgi:hypothetical protein
MTRSLLAVLLAAVPAAAADRPNVVLVVVSGLGGRDCGCYGGKRHRTPNIDRLAREGMRFTAAYAAAPVGGASRDALTTRRSAPPSAAGDAADVLDASPEHRVIAPRAGTVPDLPVRTLSGVLTNAGYVVHDGAEPGSVAANRDRQFFLHRTIAAPAEKADAEIGELLAVLDEHKLADRTLVIVTSDSGGEAILGDPPPTSNAPFRDGKGHLYEGGIRVPLVVRGPGVKAGATTDVPVIGTDLFPTVLDLCGVKAEASDGVSLRPVLAGGTLDRDALYWHQPYYTPQHGRPGGAVRAGDLKLIEFYDTGRRELFDLRKDPGESRNLVADRPADVERLAGKLAAWRTAVGAKMPTPNPAYRPHPQAADGTVTLPARTAFVDGVQLRYEPLPHKNTLGFWTRKEDTARCEFTVDKPGTFDVAVLQGCGRGSGGSEVEVAVGGSKVLFTVKDTGGFQAFERRTVGTLTIPTAGRHTLTVTPRTKSGVAVMDLREVVLTPAKR